MRNNHPFVVSLSNHERPSFDMLRMSGFNHIQLPKYNIKWLCEKPKGFNLLPYTAVLGPSSRNNWKKPLACYIL
jgi:hypothetical protein